VKTGCRQSSYHRTISLQMQLSVTISSYQHQWLSPIFLASQVIHFHIFPMNNGIGLGCPCSSSLGNPSKDHLTVMTGDDGSENVPTPPSQAETNGCRPTRRQVFFSIKCYLVGGIPTLSSVGMMTFPIYGKIKFMFQTTRIYNVLYKTVFVTVVARHQ